MTARWGAPPEGERRYVRRPGAYAVLLRAGRVLLTRQEAPVPEVQLPGGGIDPGEQPLRALHREVAEETGWTIAAPRRLLAYRRFTYMPDYDLWAEKLCTLYIARPARRIGPPTEPGHSALWVDLGAAAALVASPGDAQALRVLAGLHRRCPARADAVAVAVDGPAARWRAARRGARARPAAMFRNSCAPARR